MEMEICWAVSVNKVLKKKKSQHLCLLCHHPALKGTSLVWVQWRWFQSRWSLGLPPGPQSLPACLEPGTSPPTWWRGRPPLIQVYCLKLSLGGAHQVNGYPIPGSLRYQTLQLNRVGFRDWHPLLPRPRGTPPHILLTAASGTYPATSFDPRRWWPPLPQALFHFSYPSVHTVYKVASTAHLCSYASSRGNAAPGGRF